MARVIRPNLEKMQAAGVPFVIGTDRPRATTDAEVAMLSALGLFDNAELLHAWAVEKGAKAPQAAGVIHTDFERGFIRAEVVPVDDLVRLGSMAEARKAGIAQLEGKEYVVRDGDYILFRFNV